MNSSNKKINKKNDIKLLPRSISYDLAEVYGALIGDGCLSTYYSKSEKRQRHGIIFTGHTHDFDYYNKIIRSVFIKEFGTGGYISHRSKKRGKCVDYIINSKRIFEWFKNYGFPIGKKIKLTIPNIIIQDNKLAKACVKGIFDTDGSIYRRYTKQYKKHRHSKIYNYLVIQFKLNSKEVLEHIKEILKNNKITTTKIGEDKNSYVFRITNQKSIHRFMKIIKPNNKYHMKRYLNKCEPSFDY